MTKQTPLYEQHQNLGARFVEFAGWQMPLSYPAGTISEHLYTRKSAGLFDVSHMRVIKVVGSDAKSLIQKVLPVDAQNCSPGTVKYSFFLNDHGGIVDDLLVMFLEKEILLVVNAGSKEKDLTHLKSYGQRLDVIIDLLNDVGILALQGPHAEQVLCDFWPQAHDLSFMQLSALNYQGYPVFLSRTGYTGEDGFEVIIPNAILKTLFQLFLDHDVMPVGLGARDTLRLEAGLCLYGHDLSEDLSPIDAGLIWAIAKTRRKNPDFIGGTSIAQDILAKHGKQKRVGLITKDQVILRSGMNLLSPSNRSIVGKITSGGYSPSLGHSIAMAYVPADCMNQNFLIESRGQDFTVKLTSLPFVPHRYKF